MDHTVFQVLAGATMKKDSFRDLDLPDDAAILSELLTVLLFSLEILSLEAPKVGLEVPKAMYIVLSLSLFGTKNVEESNKMCTGQLAY